MNRFSIISHLWCLLIRCPEPAYCCPWESSRRCCRLATVFAGSFCLCVIRLEGTARDSCVELGVSQERDSVCRKWRILMRKPRKFWRPQDAFFRGVITYKSTTCMTADGDRWLFTDYLNPCINVAVKFDYLTAVSFFTRQSYAIESVATRCIRCYGNPTRAAVLKKISAFVQRSDFAGSTRLDVQATELTPESASVQLRT